jgi:hypothetical protein
MKEAAKAKNGWALFLTILIGILLGSFLATLTADIPYLNMLSYGQTFGAHKPVVLDLGVVVITFGLTITINIASLIGIFITTVMYHFIK